MMHATIAEFLDGLIVKAGAAYNGMSVFPICAIRETAPDGGAAAAPLHAALSAGWLRAEETGRMERVLLRNLGAERVIAIEGETLTGAAQNRMINVSVAASPGENIEAPACCIEVNRWDASKLEKGVNDSFTRGGVGYGALRRLKLECVEKSLSAGGPPEADQRAVWREIAAKFSDSGMGSRTLDMHELLDAWSPALAIYEQRFVMSRGQRGMITFIHRGGWFIDLFADYDLLASYFRPLLRGYAFDDLIRIEKDSNPKPAANPQIKEARAKLAEIRLSRAAALPSTTGRGGGAAFFSTRTSLGTLAHRGSELLHLTACSRSQL